MKLHILGSLRNKIPVTVMLSEDLDVPHVKWDYLQSMWTVFGQMPFLNPPLLAHLGVNKNQILNDG